MSQIYCDEAGNSGENLLDVDQPVFVLASNDYDLSEAASLLQHFKDSQASEPKFTTLKKSRSGVNRLVAFLSDSNLSNSRIVVTSFHKRFMIVTKLVDLIAETLAHEHGEDIYVRGFNIAMSNMLYQCMPPLCGVEAKDAFLSSFVTLVRKRRPEDQHAFLVPGIFWHLVVQTSA